MTATKHADVVSPAHDEVYFVWVETEWHILKWSDFHTIIREDQETKIVSAKLE